MCVNVPMFGVTDGFFFRTLSSYMCVLILLCGGPALSSAVPRLVLFVGSTLSAQSIPTMYSGQLALLAPGGLADSSSSPLPQPLKTSPSSDVLCSAYTSEAALSVPSLGGPTPGRSTVGISTLELMHFSPSCGLYFLSWCRAV